MYRRVLVPLDRSRPAECALDHVTKLARMGDIGEVILLHVLDPIFWCRDGCDFVACRHIVSGLATDYLERIKARLTAKGIRAGVKIVEGGMPASCIIAYAGDNRVDLIVMTSHGETGVKKMMFGSIALKILHDSPVPILMIRPQVRASG